VASIRLLTEVLPPACPAIVRWNKDNPQAVFRTELVQVAARLIEGTFPDYSVIILKENTTSLTIKPIREKEKEPMVDTKNDELLTVREVARRLRVNDTTVRRWIKAGSLKAISLPCYGVRHAYRIKQSTIDALLASGQTRQEMSS
jgi:excisionase family DNA binding protein